MMVARNAPAVERIYLSEMLQGGAFAWLQHNVSLNLALTLFLALTLTRTLALTTDPNQVALNAALSLRAVQAIPCDWAWFVASGGAEEKEEGEEVAATAEEEEKVVAVAATADDDAAVAQARSVVLS